MNFMGNSYMDWKEKGKGFFKGTGAREQVEGDTEEGGGMAVRSGAEGASFHLPPFTCPLILSLGKGVFGLLFPTHSGRSPDKSTGQAQFS